MKTKSILKSSSKPPQTRIKIQSQSVNVIKNRAKIEMENDENLFKTAYDYKLKSYIKTLVNNLSDRF